MTSLGWLGEAFLRVMQMVVVPVVLFAIISGVGRVKSFRKLGKLGLSAGLYYAATTVLAVVLGMTLAHLIQPGSGVTIGQASMDETADTLASTEARPEVGIESFFVKHLITDNIVRSMAENDVLPIIVFALLFATAAQAAGKKTQAVLRLADAINATMMKAVTWVMWLAPLGVFGLLAGQFGQAIADKGVDGFLRQLASLATYFGVVMAALLLHGFVTLNGALHFIGKRNPLAYAKQLLPALVTAFSSSSSSATLPITLDVLEQDNPSPAARFVLPLGSTINMDGTALYEAVAALFIAQAYGIHLSIGHEVLIVVTATLAAIGAAGIPNAGLFTMTIVLTAVDLPLEGLGLLLSVDWLLDRFRTTINVWGDAVGVAVVERFMQANATST